MLPRTVLVVALPLLALPQAGSFAAGQDAASAASRSELRTALRLDPAPKIREGARQLLSALDARNDAGDRR
ncbi:MAG: hypothetical protein HYR59_00945 [Acidobacteria bacterium]|nr:hypothetical protein [Acidobacteriota bacterium]